MKNTGKIAYKKGKIYKSETRYAITDEIGDSFHLWYDELRHHFKFVPRNKGFTARRLQSKE